MKQIITMVSLVGLVCGAFISLIAASVLSVSQTSSHPVLAGIIAGLSGGCLAATFLGIFMLVQRNRFKRDRAGFTAECVLHDGPATHILNKEGVGGWLYLTDKRLVFRSHPFNIQVHDFSIPLIELLDVAATKTARILPNGLTVKTQSGQKEHFVVIGHRKWSTEIIRAKECLP